MPTRTLNPSFEIAKEIPLEIAPLSASVRIADMFMSAFKDDSLTKYLLSVAREKKRVVKENFRLAIERASINGVIFRSSPAYEGAAVWFLSGFPKSNFRMDMAILRFKLSQFRLHNMVKLILFFLKVMKMHARIINRPHYYLGMFPFINTMGLRW